MRFRYIFEPPFLSLVYQLSSVWSNTSTLSWRASPDLYIYCSICQIAAKKGCSRSPSSRDLKFPLSPMSTVGSLREFYMATSYHQSRSIRRVAMNSFDVEAWATSVIMLFLPAADIQRTLFSTDSNTDTISSFFRGGQYRWTVTRKSRRREKGYRRQPTGFKETSNPKLNPDHAPLLLRYW